MTMERKSNRGPPTPSGKCLKIPCKGSRKNNQYET